MGFFDFLKPVEKAAGGAFHFLENNVIPGSAQVDIAKRQAQDIKSQINQAPYPTRVAVANNPQALNAYNRLDNTPSNPADTIKNFTVGAARQIARAGTSIGTSIGLTPQNRVSNAVVNSVEELIKVPVAQRAQTLRDNKGLALVLANRGIDETKLDDASLNKLIESTKASKPTQQDVTNPAAQLLIGKEPIKTLQAREQGASQSLQQKGVNPKLAPALAFLGVGGTEALNVTPLGGDKVIGKELVDNLAKETTEQGVKTLLKDKVAPELLDKVAPAIAQTKDTNIIKNLLSNKSSIATALPHPPEAPSMLPHPINDVTPLGQGSEQIANNPIQKVVDALRGQPAGPGQTPITGITNLNKQQSELYGAERSARLATASTAGADLTGRQATFAQLGALKGELPKVDSTALVEHLKTKVSPEDVNGILDTLRTHPNLSGYEPITAQNAIVKLFDEGKLPTPSEFDILQKALGPDFTDTLKTTAIDSMSSWQKVKNFAVQVLALPKSLMASLDLSGGARQGGVLGSRFIPEWANAQKESVKYFVSTDAFEKGMAEIASRENSPIYKQMGLNLAGSGGRAEEAYVSTLGEKVPIVGREVAASDRAYTGGLSLLRADSADHIIKNLQDAGIDPSTLGDKALKDLGRFINTASGRGDLGSLEKHAQSLGEALFSPRLWKSRLDMLNPAYYAKLDPIARKYALQSAGSFAAIAGTVLSLAALAGAKVETDARSSDFLKVKVGDTRYDILGGFQQNLVFAWRELKGQKKSSITGNVSDLNSGKFGAANRLSILSDLVQNKENPVINVATTQIKGQDKAGNQLTPGARAAAIGNLFVPLNIQDTYKTIQNTGSIPEGLLKATVPGTVGVGVGTYGLKDIQPSGKQKEYLQKLQDKGAPKAQIDASKSFFQTLKSGPDRTATADNIKKSITNPDGTFNEAGTAKAAQLAQDYNKKYKAAFNDWRSKYGQYRTDKILVKEFNSNLITDDTINRYVVALKKASQ